MRLERNREQERRFGAAVVMLVLLIVAGLALGAIADESGPGVRRFVVGAFPPTAVGLMVLAWRWPNSTLKPLAYIWRMVRG